MPIIVSVDNRELQDEEDDGVEEEAAQPRLRGLPRVPPISMRRWRSVVAMISEDRD